MATSYFTLPQIAVASKERLSILVPGPAMDASDRESGLAVLLSLVAQVKTQNIHMVGIVLSCFTFGIPEMASHFSSMSSLDVVLVPLTAADIAAVAGGSPPGTKGADSVFKGLVPNPDCIDIDTTEGLFASLSSLLFAIGKQAGNGPEAGAVKARPDALIRRFGIAEDQQALLPGRTLGPSQQTLESIYGVFSTYTEPRMKVIQLFLSLSAQGGHPSKHVEILLTNFRMMRGAGMTHVGAILSLAQMHPWTLRVPELGAYYAKFVVETRKFEQVPAPVRQYHRLLVPQSEFLFLTTEYKPLIAVAGDFLSDVEETFSRYVYGKNDYATLIARVRSYEPSKSKFIGKGTLAEALGVPDMDLPPRKVTAVVASAPIA